MEIKTGEEIKRLAEAVILNAVEDLWDEPENKESIGFFIGSGFQIYAGMAGMSQAERSGLLGIIRPLLGDCMAKGKRLKNIVSKLPDTLSYGLTSCSRGRRALHIHAA